MVHEIRKQANNLGLTKLRMTLLYARPKKLSLLFAKHKPDTADVIQDYMKLIDPSSVESSSGGARNSTYYCLAPQEKFYVEIIDKAAGIWVASPANHALQISIFSDNDEHIRGIANTVNQRWEDGILPHMDWKKIEKKYKVKREDAIATWNHFLTM